VSNGVPGVPGEPGADGQTYYTWIKYADTAQRGGMSDDPTGKDYIGFAYNKTTATESANKADYAWSLIKGTDGVPGEPGADGQTYYTWIKYADTADGTGLYDTPTESTRYIGIAVNKTTATESANKADYTWSLFKGSDGVSLFIENDSVSINCDAYGVPYPGMLPLSTKAASIQNSLDIRRQSWAMTTPIAMASGPCFLM
jgi:hypothetical protein